MEEGEYKRLILDAIFELRGLFKSSPHIFLTEDDVRCVLYHLLVSRIGFKRLSNGETMSPVHAEVRWYGKRKNLRKRSDLVVLDPTDIRVTSEGFPLPSKGFGFNNFYAAIELKLRRKGGDSDKVWLNKLKKDANALLSLLSEINNAYSPLLVLIAFDRKSNISGIMEQAQFGVDTVYESMRDL